MSSPTMNEKESNIDRPISDESVLKIAKEITVKFIEVGRITPATFSQDFKAIFSSIEATVREK